MNEDVRKKLEEVIVACADKAKQESDPLGAMQFTQAAVNASNVIIGLENQGK